MIKTKPQLKILRNKQVGLVPYSCQTLICFSYFEQTFVYNVETVQVVIFGKKNFKHLEYYWPRHTFCVKLGLLEQKKG